MPTVTFHYDTEHQSFDVEASVLDGSLPTRIDDRVPAEVEFLTVYLDGNIYYPDNAMIVKLEEIALEQYIYNN